MARLTASASNVANANSRGAVPGSDAAANPAAQSVYQPVRVRQSPTIGGGVTSRFVAVQPGYTLAYEPTAPYANVQGMVATSDVNLADEMVEQLSAKLAFQANAKVFGTINTLQQDSIERWG